MKDIIPVLNEIEKLSDDDKPASTELIDKITELVLIVLQKNHPELKLKDVEDLVDLKQARLILKIGTGQDEG